ncbi:hypothetical protein [Heyndrickxia oleronia]|uniref:Uncharacterized protein n=1 Tax=Heyndrickxia oleronia TaxID=38875 RepID=A0AAW6T514_9BACI|nr:hypothetical protein [Heyndrickxia oleronia]MDH5163759.1 hypothetical protein [Heyndrickxia oleronia]
MIFAPVTINFQTLKVNSLDHSAVLNMGTNQYLDVFVSYKRNQGIGEQNGDFVHMLLPVSAVDDSDVLDSPSVKNSLI